MAAKTFDLDSYRNLLSETHPRAPHTARENERLITIVNDLQGKPKLSAEERALMELLLVLIQKFEDEHYGTEGAGPHDILKELMRANDLKPKDLYEIFGSKGTTSEVLRGKRGISKSAVKILARRFHVSADLFL